jgi:hypothetical protein
LADLNTEDGADFRNVVRITSTDFEVLLQMIDWLQNIKLHRILACPHSEHLSWR